VNQTIRLCDSNAGLFVGMCVAGAAGAPRGRAKGVMAGHNQLEIVEHDR
jgi:hypothetical protein